MNSKLKNKPKLHDLKQDEGFYSHKTRQKIPIYIEYFRLYSLGKTRCHPLVSTEQLDHIL